MRMVTVAQALLAFGVVATVAANPALAQRARTAAPAAPAGPASLAGRWEGTYANDMTQRGGRLVITLAGSDESATGEIALTPVGAKGPVLAEGVSMPTARGAKGPGGLPVTLMKTGDDKVSGSVDAAYVDPGCNCTVITSVDATLNGSTLSGSFAARDSKTGNWNFTSFTATKRVAGR